MSITNITQSIASLTEAHKETMALITKLRKLEGVGVDSQRTEIVTLIHQSLKDTEQELELLHVQIDDLSFGEHKTSLTSKWHKLSEDTKIARAAYRKAQMEAKRNTEAARRQERELLLGSADGKRRMRGANQLSQEELILNASNDITSSLRRTHNLLASELSRSQFASETLNSSTQALKELSTRYSTFDDLLLKSRRLITDLVRKNKSDAWYYEKAIYIMVVTIAWLIIRRFLYGPFYLLVWLPLKLCWYVLSLFGAIIGAGGGYDAGIIQEGDAKPGVVENMAQNQHRVGVKGIPQDIPTIPASILPAKSAPRDQSPPLPVEEKESSERPPMGRGKGDELLLDKVGEAIMQQQGQEGIRQYVAEEGQPEVGHDEL